MNILYDITSLKPRISGISFRYENVIKLLSEKNNIIVCGYDKDFHKYLPEKIKYIYMNEIELPMYKNQKIYNLFYTLPDLKKLSDIIINNNINIVQISWPNTNIFLWSFLKSVYNFKLVISYHTDIVSYLPYYNMDNIISKNILKYYDYYAFYNADLVYFMSDMHKNRLINNYNYDLNFNNKNLHVGIDNNIFREYNYNKEIDSLWLKNKLKLLIVSRISVEKNIFFITDCVKDLKHVSLVIIGKGPDEDKLKKIQYNNINFIGKVEHSKLGEYYSHADFFIQPSNNETLGFTVLESLASGTPTIVCKNYSPFIEENYNGYSYECNNKESFVNLINSNLNKENLKNNCIEYSKKFTWENMGVQLEDNYKQIINEGFNKNNSLLIIRLILILSIIICIFIFTKMI